MPNLASKTMVATSKKASIKGALGRRRQKTAPPKTQGGDDTAELDRLVKEKIVSANNNKKWLKVKTALEETPRASNSSTRNWQETRGDECNDDGYSYSDESRDESALEHKSFDSCGSSTMGESLAHCGSSWDDEDQQENAFFEKSVKVETHQAVVKVLEHGNTQMLVLEVSSHGMVSILYICVKPFSFTYYCSTNLSVLCCRLIQPREYLNVPSQMMW
mmetsp:Transcript_32991/g.67414  ORF Transcript_32991/g.67414 Transcript_32991/m.67414 type:complete len:218 (-) Transcript_32991:3-656(-)